MQLSELSDDPELRLHPDRAGFSSNDMELDPIQDRFIFDRTSVGGPSSECFEVCFAGSVDVGVVYESERDQFDRVNLDLAATNAVPTPRFHLRPSPQTERHRDVTRHDRVTKLAAELHGPTLRHIPGALRRLRCSACSNRRQHPILTHGCPEA